MHYYAWRPFSHTMSLYHFQVWILVMWYWSSNAIAAQWSSTEMNRSTKYLWRSSIITMTKHMWRDNDQVLMQSNGSFKMINVFNSCYINNKWSDLFYLIYNFANMLHHWHLQQFRHHVDQWIWVQRDDAGGETRRNLFSGWTVFPLNPFFHYFRLPCSFIFCLISLSPIPTLHHARLWWRRLRVSPLHGGTWHCRSEF